MLCFNSKQLFISKQATLKVFFYFFINKDKSCIQGIKGVSLYVQGKGHYLVKATPLFCEKSLDFFFRKKIKEGSSFYLLVSLRTKRNTKCPFEGIRDARIPLSFQSSNKKNTNFGTLKGHLSRKKGYDMHPEKILIVIFFCA